MAGPTEPAGPSRPVFPDPRDAEGLARFSQELYSLAGRRCQVWPYRAGPRSEEDVFYGEAPFKDNPEELMYETSCLIPNLPGWGGKLTPAGIDEERPLVIYFNPDLILKDGHPLPRTGDHILLQGDRYKVEQTNPANWFANADRKLPGAPAFAHVCQVQRWVPTSTSAYSTKVEEEPE